MIRRVADARGRVDRVRLLHPRERVGRARIRCDDLADRLDAAMGRLRDRRRDRLLSMEGRLGALSPLRVLDRGYAIVQHEGRALTDTAGVVPGDGLRVRLARGEIDTTVTRVRPG